MIRLKFERVNMRLVKHREHRILSLLYCFSAFAFSRLLQQINRRGIKRQFFITECKTNKHTLAFICFELWNVKWTSAISLKLWCFCSFLMIQLEFIEPLSCVTPQVLTQKQLNAWIYSMNWQEDSHSYSEVMNGNAVFSDSITESSAA